MEPETQQRLEQVELKLMDLEQSFAQLNDVVIRQYAEIDRLQSLLNRMEDKLTSQAQDESASNGHIEPPPPHY